MSIESIIILVFCYCSRVKFFLVLNHLTHFIKALSVHSVLCLWVLFLKLFLFLGFLTVTAGSLIYLVVLTRPDFFCSLFSGNSYGLRLERLFASEA